MSPTCRRGLVLLAVLLAPGCAGLRTARSAPLPPAAGPVRGEILVLDGAGNFQALSRNLRSVVAEDGVPLRVETVNWSHGYGRVLADHLDQENIEDSAQLLAGWVRTARQTCPGLPISIVAHSAGTAVILRATELLPAGSLERIVLLAPSVSACHDLRPALACARRGVDVFTSEHDRAYLGLGVALTGTTDRLGGPAAGRYGFQPGGGCPGDDLLYARLRQHPWHSSVAWTGNWGGHYGAYQPTYLRAYVLPLLVP